MTTETNSVELATELTIAWLTNPNTRPSANEVPAFLQSMYEAVTKLVAPVEQAPTDAPVEEFVPAVSVRKSLASKDHIISMIDGKPYKVLRRHLSTNDLTPEQYRERYNLKADYPMVAEAYSENRRAMAKKIGLGRKPDQPSTKITTPRSATEPAPAVAPASAKPRRKAKTAAVTEVQ